MKHRKDQQTRQGLESNDTSRYDSLSDELRHGKGEASAAAFL